MKKYRTGYPTVDIIIEKEGKIVLIRRGNEPFKGELSIPGGFVNSDETVEAAAVREAKEETGLDVEVTNIVGVYSDPKRDPRGENVATVFAAKVVGGELKGGSDARDAKWFNLSEVEKMKFSFDHDKMIADYVKWKRQKGTYWSTR